MIRTSILLFLVLICGIAKAQIEVFDDPQNPSARTVIIDMDCDDGIQIHPVDDDFSNGFIGRLLVSTIHDDQNDPSRYYTKYQIGDAQVSVEVIMPASYFGQKIYFELEDPDLDDLSPYEPDDLSGDNLGGLGKFENEEVYQEKVVSTFQDVDGIDQIGAKTTLTITSTYSGDNYKVKIFADNPTTGEKEAIGETSTMVAWKRYYIEIDAMYNKGATIVSPYKLDADTEDDFILVDNTNDFVADQNIEIFSFDPNIPFISAKIVSVVPPIRLNITDNSTIDNKIFESSSGVRIVSNTGKVVGGTIRDIVFDKINEAFGGDTRGTDGGCFVEFKKREIGNNDIPKFTEITSVNIAADIAQKWRLTSNIGSPNYMDNLFQVILAHKVNNNANAGTIIEDNVTFLWNYTFRMAGVDPNFTWNKAAPETMVHELIHQLINLPQPDGLIYDFIHAYIKKDEWKNHEKTDQATMSYARNFSKYADLHLDIIKYIRENVTVVD